MINGPSPNVPQSPQPGGGMSPLLAIVLVVIGVVVLSAFRQTKKWAYWAGGIALFLMLYPTWRKSGFAIPGSGGS